MASKKKSGKSKNDDGTEVHEDEREEKEDSEEELDENEIDNRQKVEIKKKSHYKDGPPKFDESKYTWLQFKKKLNLWESLTPLDDTEKGSIVYLSLTGRAEEIVRNIPENVIKSRNGYKRIVEALDKIFIRDINQDVYLTYKEFEELKRESDVNIKDFLIKFDDLKSRLNMLHMELPEGVLVYRLLQSANLSADDKRACVTSVVEFTYDHMKSTLLRICADEVTRKTENFSNLRIKEEECFYTEGIPEENKTFYTSNYRGRFNRGNFNSQYRGNNRYDRGNTQRGNNRYNNSKRYENSNRYDNNQYENSNNNQYNGKGNGNYKGRGKFSNNKLNPMNSEGNVTRCNICDSKYHWQYSCPDRNTATVTKEELNLYTILQTTSEEDRTTLVNESTGRAVVDSGCNKTVMGEKWYETYKNALSNENREKIQMKKSE